MQSAKNGLRKIAHFPCSNGSPLVLSRLNNATAGFILCQPGFHWDPKGGAYTSRTRLKSVPVLYLDQSSVNIKNSTLQRPNGYGPRKWPFGQLSSFQIYALNWNFYTVVSQMVKNASQRAKRLTKKPRDKSAQLKFWYKKHIADPDMSGFEQNFSIIGDPQDPAEHSSLANGYQPQNGQHQLNPRKTANSPTQTDMPFKVVGHLWS